MALLSEAGWSRPLREGVLRRREDADVDLAALLDPFRNGCARPELGVIRVRGEDEDASWEVQGACLSAGSRTFSRPGLKCRPEDPGIFVSRNSRRQYGGVATLPRGGNTSINTWCAFRRLSRGARAGAPRTGARRKRSPSGREEKALRKGMDRGMRSAPTRGIEGASRRWPAGQSVVCSSASAGSSADSAGVSVSGSASRS